MPEPCTWCKVTLVSSGDLDRNTTGCTASSPKWLAVIPTRGLLKFKNLISVKVGVGMQGVGFEIRDVTGGSQQQS